MSQAPPPNWYQDPEFGDAVRWWDGHQWTEHRAPRPQPAGPGGHVAHPGQSVEPPPQQAVQPGAPPTQNPPSPQSPLTAKGVNGTVSFDGQFVTIARTGALARMSIGKGDKRIPVRSVTAVQWKKPGPFVNGFISFTLGGGNERRSQFGHQSMDAARDENSVIVTLKQQESFVELRAVIEAAIAAGDQPAQRTTEPAPPDVMAQLLQLGQLRDRGVVTPEEFEAKKADLLRRL